MNEMNEVAQKIAESLLQIKAIKLQTQNPFTWASGWKSPIYCDNRIALSHPSIRTYIRQKLSQVVQDGFGSVEMISGVATAGIPQGVLVAQDLGLPFSYVRNDSKEHGRKNMIEGEIVSGQRVVVIEDLISTGKSSLKAVEALREAGCNVVGMVSIFNYGFDEAVKNFEEAKCEIISLCDYDALIEVAAKFNYIHSNEIEALKEWRVDPANWSPTAL